MGKPSGKRNSRRTEAEASVGVVTRARAKALKKSGSVDECYLHLRSRRLPRRITAVNKPRKTNAASLKPKQQVQPSTAPLPLQMPSGEMQKAKENNGIHSQNLLEMINADCGEEHDKGSLGQDQGITKESRLPVGSAKVKNEHPIILSAEEVEEFFDQVENQQIQPFIEKYNFDPVKEKPLEGRYEWSKP